MSNIGIGVKKQVDLSNPKDVFKKVLRDGIKNILFYGVGALIIAFIMNGLGWRMVGFVLACIFSLVAGIGIIKFVLFDFPLQIFGLLVAIKERIRGESNLLGTQFYLLCGTLVLLIENGLSSVYILYLYYVYYKVDLLGIFG